MIDNYFSERELGKQVLNKEEIDYKVFNGILMLFNQYKKGFSKLFPIKCEDSDAIICGVNDRRLQAAIMAEIPDFDMEFSLIEDGDEINKYVVLDFIEYCYNNISDIEETGYHDYCRHYHLSIKDSKNDRENFRKGVNRIFERNKVIFYLDADGQVKRGLPLEMSTVIKKVNIETSDTKLNELIVLAIDKIQKPNIEDRKIALEKLWDAFERMKSYYQANKRKSIEQLLLAVATDTEELYEVLDSESTALTDIGNKYQIRHFEKGKIEIKSLKHIDYLFYRMIAFINLCVSILK